MIPFLIKSAVSFLFLAAGIHYWQSGTMTKEGLSPNDPSSHSHPEDCRLVHLDLELNADFNKHIFSGFAHLTVEKQKDGVDTVIESRLCPELADCLLSASVQCLISGNGPIKDSSKNPECVLDSKDLKIKNVTDQSTGQHLSYSLGDKLEVFGSRLEVRLPTANGNKLNISIEYETSPQASAFQWLTADQTAGKRQPYLFSQCQAIHCRSFVPCQDTPSVKFPYTAKITAPKEITLLMSAISTGSETDSSDNTKTIYRFEQKVPIPSYLIAIVGGDLESRDIGPRSKVWSEKEFVDAAAFEFSETETMLKTAESLCGPYVWGRYDLLVLPPSFPYGGMENPCLTFVTPTLLAGDKSLADVVAHEISHSWTGNLVTNKNPEHFWLNEGHTVFVERKIQGRMFGEPSRQLSAAEGWNDLQQNVVLLSLPKSDREQQQIQVFKNWFQQARNKNLQPPTFDANMLQTDYQGRCFKNGPYTKLIPDLRGVDPDDAFSIVPYEKGFTLLYYLETLLGGPDEFEPFLKAYIEKFKYKSIDSNQWKDFLFSFFQSKVDVLNKVDWDTWFSGVGMPPIKPEYDESLAVPCQELCDKWSATSDSDLSQFSANDILKMTSNQIRIFLYKVLLLESPLSLIKVKKMEELYKFNDRKNSEIRLKWLLLCLKAHWEDSIQYALKFVNEQGRMKFVRPIYRALYAWEGSRDTAIKNFLSKRPEMHTTTAELVGKDLHLGSS